jgi:hypothetical protein
LESITLNEERYITMEGMGVIETSGTISIASHNDQKIV